MKGCGEPGLRLRQRRGDGGAGAGRVAGARAGIGGCTRSVVAARRGHGDPAGGREWCRGGRRSRVVAGLAVRRRPPGVNGLSKLVVGFASGLFERSIYIENPLLPAIATFVGTLLGEVLLVIFALIVGL